MPLGEKQWTSSVQAVLHKTCRGDTLQSAADIEQYSALLRIRRSERPAPSATGRAGRPPNQRQGRLSRGGPDPVQTTRYSIRVGRGAGGRKRP